MVEFYLLKFCSWMVQIELRTPTGRRLGKREDCCNLLDFDQKIRMGDNELINYNSTFRFHMLGYIEVYRWAILKVAISLNLLNIFNFMGKSS